jgi:hypothetical protein
VASGLGRGEQFRSQPSAPKCGILYYSTLGNDVSADSLDRRFVHHASPAHCPKIRWRLISIIRDLGAGYDAATDHQFNPLIAHEANVIMTRAGKRFQNAPMRPWAPPRRVEGDWAPPTLPGAAERMSATRKAQAPQFAANVLLIIRDMQATARELGCLIRLRYVDHSARLTHAVINGDLQNRKTGFDFQCGRPRSLGRFE